VHFPAITTLTRVLPVRPAVEGTTAENGSWPSCFDLEGTPSSIRTSIEQYLWVRSARLPQGGLASK
jgi:hypothetical protein